MMNARLKGIDTIHDYAARLGLTERTGIDLPGEAAGLVASTEWKLRTSKGEKWYAGETISVGIGQGPVSVTPIALGTMMTAIATGGTLATPHVVKAVDTGAGWTPVPMSSAPRPVFPIKPEVLEPVRDGLWGAVNGDGTAFAARVAGHDVVGKTGTAQVVSSETAKAMAAAKSGMNVRDNSWFVCLTPPATIPKLPGWCSPSYGGVVAPRWRPLPIAQLRPRNVLRQERGAPAADAHGDARRVHDQRGGEGEPASALGHGPGHGAGHDGGLIK